MLNKLPVYILLYAAPLFAQPQVKDTIVASNAAAKATTVTYVQDTAVAYTPRAFDKDFRERHKGDEYVYEVKPLDKTWWDRFMAWLGNLWESVFGNGNNKNSSNWADWLIVTAACLIIMGAVYMIARAILNKEGMWIFGRSRKNLAVREGMEEDIHQMDFKKLVDDTKASGNYRLGVRYYYLWLLKKLSNREIIDWHWDKTNTDYLYEIKNEDTRREFEYLSYLYDHSWYGEFPLDETSFGKAEKAFLKTLNKL